jgi:hypothetical protein
MSRYNHFAPVKYEPVNFNEVSVGQKFRMRKYNGQIARYLIMKKTGEFTYEELKSKAEHKLYNTDITVYKYEQ